MKISQSPQSKENDSTQKIFRKSVTVGVAELVDNRLSTVVQRKLQDKMDTMPLSQGKKTLIL